MPPAPSASLTLTGTALYRERFALPPDACLSGRISEGGRMDAPVPVIAETEMAAEERQVPLAFSFTYDPVRIELRGS